MKPDGRIKGRGALSNPASRFAKRVHEADMAELAACAASDEDGDCADPLPTELHVDRARTIIARNASPDSALSVNRSIRIAAASTAASIAMRGNPRLPRPVAGARLRDADLLQAERRRAAARRARRPELRREPDRARHEHRSLPARRTQLRITRGILELLLELRHPLTIVTKGALDPARPRSARDVSPPTDWPRCMVSLTTLDDELKRRLEPRTAGPKRRLQDDSRAREHAGSRPACCPRRSFPG